MDEHAIKNLVLGLDRRKHRHAGRILRGSIETMRGEDTIWFRLSVPGGRIECRLPNTDGNRHWLAVLSQIEAPVEVEGVCDDDLSVVYLTDIRPAPVKAKKSKKTPTRKTP